MYLYMFRTKIFKILAKQNVSNPGHFFEGNKPLTEMKYVNHIALKYV